MDSPTWFSRSGAYADVVLSSRLRVVRNMDGVSYPEFLLPQTKKILFENVENFFRLNGMENEYSSYLLDGMDNRRKEVFYEQRFIPYRVVMNPGCGLFLRKSMDLSVVTGDTDHLKIIGLRNGLNLRDPYKDVMALVARFNEAFPLAGNGGMFYTSRLDDYGSGVRFSVVVQLSGLVAKGQIDRLIIEFLRLGYLVTELSGEPEEGVSDLYQITSRSSASYLSDDPLQSGMDLLEDFEDKIKTLVKVEHSARKKGKRECSRKWAESSIEKNGIKGVTALTQGESLELISLLRSAVSLGFIKGLPTSILNGLYIETQETLLIDFLDSNKGREAKATDICRNRAELFSRRLSPYI